MHSQPKPGCKVFTASSNPCQLQAGCFHLNLHVSPTHLMVVKMIEDHHVFTNKPYVSQTPVSEQLAMAVRATLLTQGENST
jgi:hypothetical protein